MPWQKNGTPNTLAITSDTLAVNNLTAQDSSVFLFHSIATGGTEVGLIHLDGDTGTNYANRESNNGGGDAVNINDPQLQLAKAGADDNSGLGVVYISNIAGQEKLAVADVMAANTAGVGSVPNRREWAGKWANTTQFTQVNATNAGSGDFAINSNVSVLSDVPTPIPPPETIGGWIELGRTTLGSANATIDVTGLADKRYYMILCNSAGQGSSNTGTQLNGDTGNNYAKRSSTNGGADSTEINFPDMEAGAGGTNPIFQVAYLANLATQEKLHISHLTTGTILGAGTAPLRNQTVGKHAQTTNPVSSYQWITSSANTFATGSQCVVLGWDPDDIHTTNFWEELNTTSFSGSESTFDTGGFTPKKYLWIQGTIEGTSSLRPGSFQFNSDIAANYAIRRSHNGVADATFANTTSIDTQGGGNVTNYFFNMFVINNFSDEKLVNFNVTSFATAGSGAAPLRDEMVGKWVNTTDQITKLTVRSGDSGSLTSGDVTVWGAD